MAFENKLGSALTKSVWNHRHGCDDFNPELSFYIYFSFRLVIISKF